jgi:hypothetical protein
MKSRAVLQHPAVSVIQRCHAGLDLDGLRDEALPPLLRAVPGDALFFAVADPATLLHTRRYVQGFPPGLSARFRERGVEIARRVRSGSVGIGHYTYDMNSPTTMIKSSGLGPNFGPEAVAAYQRFQSVYL